MAGDLVRFKKRFYSHRSLWPIEMPPVVCEDDFTCREKESVYFGYRKMIFQLSWDWRIYWIRATLQLHVLQFIQRNINRLTYRKYYKAYWIDSRRFLTTQSSPHLIDFAQRITTLNKGGSLASCDNLKQSPILIKLGETNIVDKYKYQKANAYHIYTIVQHSSFRLLLYIYRSTAVWDAATWVNPSNWHLLTNAPFHTHRHIYDTALLEPTTTAAYASLDDAKTMNKTCERAQARTINMNPLPFEFIFHSRDFHRHTERARSFHWNRELRNPNNNNTCVFAVV